MAATAQRSGSAPRGAAIASIGVALPRERVPNGPIATRLGVDDRWIVKRAGVHERRVLQPDERLSDLIAEAAVHALRRASLDASALDLILVGTFTQDELLPHAAPLVAGELGATRAGVIDVGAACLGFLSALALGAAHIEAARAEAVLVVGAEALTRFLDMDDRRTAALFGDGAGAVVLTRAERPGRIGPAVLRADAASRDAIYMTREEAKLRMEGQRTFVCAVDRLAEVTLEVLEASGLTLAEIDLFVYHQANARITRAVSKRLKLDSDRVVDCIEGFGNTSAASIPLALDWAVRQGRLHEGARVLMAATGAGFVWGGLVVEWSGDDA
ncbi:MAG TPA: beta-ketoacyl-ACP synthase 3 [Solirubrobacteraceae bacterium]|nr:beta-ketoacyl-ACP synthase 3 [Solirubrobacteraceae bacterium]